MTAAYLVDVRGLPPCEPMEQILRGLDALSPGQSLHAILDREPIYLYPILNERGFEWRVLVAADDRFELLIAAAEDSSLQ